MPLTPYEPPRRAHRFDIVVSDGHDAPILVVEIKRIGVSLDRLVEDTKEYVAAAARHAPFFLIANPDSIYLYMRQENDTWTLARKFDAASILRRYDSAYGKDPVYEYYLTSLVQAWLNDIAYNWHSSNPPESDAFEQLDLLTGIRNGSMAVDVAL